MRRSSPAVASCTARSRADYDQRTPKKMKAAALRGALSDRARNDRVHVVSALVAGDAPSTKAAAATLAKVSDRASTCCVVAERTDELDLAEPAQRAPTCTCSSRASSTPTTC